MAKGTESAASRNPADSVTALQETEQCVGKPAEQSPEGMASQQGRTTSDRLKTSAVLHLVRSLVVSHQELVPI